MCLPNLMKFYQGFFKILRKQNVSDKRSDVRTDNVKTVYSPTNIVCGGIITLMTSVSTIVMKRYVNKQTNEKCIVLVAIFKD